MIKPTSIDFLNYSGTKLHCSGTKLHWKDKRQVSKSKMMIKHRMKSAGKSLFQKLKAKKKLVVFTLALAALLVANDESYSRRLSNYMSLNLGDGQCEWRAALQWYDEGFPTDTTFKKSIIAGYPSGDKRLAFTQLEGLTGLSARDEWDFKFLGVTNQPFIKANYPHHEGKIYILGFDLFSVSFV